MALWAVSFAERAAGPWLKRTRRLSSPKTPMKTPSRRKCARAFHLPAIRALVEIDLVDFDQGDAGAAISPEHDCRVIAGSNRTSTAASFGFVGGIPVLMMS